MTRQKQLLLLGVGVAGELRPALDPGMKGRDNGGTADLPVAARRQ